MFCGLGWPPTLDSPLGFRLQSEGITGIVQHAQLIVLVSQKKKTWASRFPTASLWRRERDLAFSLLCVQVPDICTGACAPGMFRGQRVSCLNLLRQGLIGQRLTPRGHRPLSWLPLIFLSQSTCLSDKCSYHLSFKVFVGESRWSWSTGGCEHLEYRWL